LPSVSPDGSLVVYISIDNNGFHPVEITTERRDAVQLETGRLPDRRFRPTATSSFASNVKTRCKLGNRRLLPITGGEPIKTFKIVPTMFTKAGLRWLHGEEGFTYVTTAMGCRIYGVNPWQGAPRN